MADNVVNLNKARKDREKAGRAAKAQENRARFGRTKAETTISKLEEARARRAHDDRKREE